MRLLTHQCRTVLYLVATTNLAFVLPARANIVITPTFEASITSDPNSAAIISTINQAISFYESNITNSIIVSMDFGEMGTGLGQSSTFIGTIGYSQYLSALQGNSSGDAVDLSALASLPAGPNNPVNGDLNIVLTTANLRALGINAVPPGPDSTVTVNTSITNYPGMAFDPSKYSLLAVIEHEMDEGLGLGSHLDSGSTTGAIRVEDLFRYSANGVRSFTTSSGATAYLSVDGGLTDLIGFNQSGPPGGADYGDWASSGTPHVQDAFGTPGANPVFGVEQTALDVIGYNFSSPTPEPSTLWLLAVGTVAVLARARRSQQR